MIKAKNNLREGEPQVAMHHQLPPCLVIITIIIIIITVSIMLKASVSDRMTVPTSLIGHLSGQLNEMVLTTMFLSAFISATRLVTSDMLVSGFPSVSK